jgi:hypothetical protein
MTGEFQMFDKKQGIHRAAATVAGMVCGLLPLAAQAAGPQGDVMFSTVTSVSCASSSGSEPVTVAAEPRADAVKDAPFSGIGTTEVVTTLADGNRIVRTNTMKFYRDKAGRTRTEYSLNAIGPFTPDQARSIVTITDPAESKSYVLHADSKRADVFRIGNFGIGRLAAVGGATGPGPAHVTVENGVTTAGTPRGVPPRGVTMRSTTTVMSPGVMAGPGRGAGVAVSAPLVVMSSGAALPPPPNAGIIMQYAAPLPSDACKPNSKPLPAPASLGERIIEGLKVTGTRMEFTIPQGAVGNEQPIVVSSEQWFSPELGVVVSSTHRDPMMGDTAYRLEQINRTEPDTSLFTVPSDYTVNDVGANGGAVFFQKRIGPEEPDEK